MRPAGITPGPPPASDRARAKGGTGLAGGRRRTIPSDTSRGSPARPRRAPNEAANSASAGVSPSASSAQATITGASAPAIASRSAASLRGSVGRENRRSRPIAAGSAASTASTSVARNARSTGERAGSPATVSSSMASTTTRGSGGGATRERTASATPASSRSPAARASAAANAAIRADAPTRPPRRDATSAGSGVSEAARAPIRGRGRSDNRSARRDGVPDGNSGYNHREPDHRASGLQKREPLA